jgi:signal transduction histidine kinase
MPDSEQIFTPNQSPCCPVTGLPITAKPEWTEIHLTSDYCVTFSIIGNAILLTTPKGFPGEVGAKTLLEKRAAVIKEAGLSDRKYVEIRDYRMLTGAAPKGARMVLTNFLVKDGSEGHLIGFWVFGAPFLIRLMFHAGLKVYKNPIPIGEAKDYREALLNALKVLRQNRVDVGLKRYQNLKKDEWVLELEGFGISFELIGDDILYNSTHGRWKESHVEQFICLHEKVIREAGLTQKGYFYRIVNWESLEKSTWKARKMYIEGLNEINKKIPCKLAVVFGLNKFMKTLVGISSPFISYPVMVANDLQEALEITEREREREISAGSAGKRQKHGSKIYTEEQLKGFSNELLQVIGGINWDQAGLSLDGISEEHPLKPVLDALAIVKLDLDYLLQEKENSQKSLSHAEKLVTMGTIVASVAHEINNPNNSLMLDAQFNQNAWRSVSAVLDEHADENGGLLIGGFAYGEFKTAVVDASNRMKRNTERIKHIVENLRAIAKKDADFDEDVDLNATVRSALSVIEYLTAKYTRNLSVNLGDTLPRIRGNTQCLEQVIINLVKNACQSLPSMEKGVFISTAFEPEKNAVSFTIRDQGKGMDEKTLKEIFIPFYTTKGKEGTGLGLSICDNIIKNHGGTIKVESKLGEGTTVNFLLPLATAPA